MERAILSLSPENILTVWLMVILLYLGSALAYQAYKRLSGGGGGGATVVNQQSGM